MMTMGLKGCEVILDNPENTIYAGQTVIGKVKLNLKAPQKVRGIMIRFTGEGRTEWVELRSATDQRNDNETTYLKGHEEYLKKDFYILGDKNSPEIELPAGTYNYPFTYVLPTNLPSSFEGEYGYIRYAIKVTLDRSWKLDKQMKTPFIVIAQVDLNLHPRVKEPFNLDLEKSFCCFCCRSDPLTVLVSVPVTGYVSGQSVPITCDCDNLGNVDISSIKFELFKLITFRINKPHREKREFKMVVAALSVGPVAAGESRTFALQLQIPDRLPPSNLLNCRLIDLVYDLRVQCNFSGAHRNLTGKIPITLGTIPLSSPPRRAGSRGLLRILTQPQFVETDYRRPGVTEQTQTIGDIAFAPLYSTFQFESFDPA